MFICTIYTPNQNNRYTLLFNKQVTITMKISLKTELLFNDYTSIWQHLSNKKKI